MISMRFGELFRDMGRNMHPGPPWIPGIIGQKLGPVSYWWTFMDLTCGGVTLTSWRSSLSQRSGFGESNDLLESAPEPASDALSLHQTLLTSPVTILQESHTQEVTIDLSSVTTTVATTAPTATTEVTTSTAATPVCHAIH